LAIVASRFVSDHLIDLVAGGSVEEIRMVAGYLMVMARQRESGWSLRRDYEERFGLQRDHSYDVIKMMNSLERCQKWGLRNQAGVNAAVAEVGIEKMGYWSAAFAGLKSVVGEGEHEKDAEGWPKVSAQ